MSTRSHELSVKERAALFALLAVARKIPNLELEKFVGFRLTGDPRRELNRLGLVKSERIGRSYSHELTPAGYQWCAGEQSAMPPKRRGVGRGDNMERALYAVLAGLGRYQSRTGKSLPDIFGYRGSGQTAADVIEDAESTDVETLIRTRYAGLAEEPGELVQLHQLRLALPDVSRAELDAALDGMYRTQRINLIAQADQGSLTDAERGAALLIGGRNKHLISIGRS
jgi:hypothetical protein